MVLRNMLWATPCNRELVMARNGHWLIDYIIQIIHIYFNFFNTTIFLIKVLIVNDTLDLFLRLVWDILI